MSTMPISAILTSVNVSFFVPEKTNDKDFDTKVSVALRTTDLKLIAEANNIAPGVSFHDRNLTYGPFPLKLTQLGLNISKDLLTHGSLSITISPNGNDTWVFHPMLFLTFSDGSQINHNNLGTLTRRVVDQNAKIAECTF